MEMSFLPGMFFSDHGILSASRQPRQPGLQTTERRQHLREKNNEIPLAEAQFGPGQVRRNFLGMQQGHAIIKWAVPHHPSGEGIPRIVFEQDEVPARRQMSRGGNSEA